MADADLTIVKSEPLPELTLADKPEAPEGALSRFGGAALGALTSPVHFAQALVTDPKGLYDSLVNQSAEHFEKAAQLWKDKQYGPAVHRAIAGVIPPYGVVPEAADKIRAGDVAGGLGEAVGSGLTPKVVSMIPAVARGAVKAGPAMASGAIKAGAAAADLVSPDVVGVVSPRAGQVLRVVQKLRDAAAKPPARTGPAPRLVKQGAPLSDQLQTVLEELKNEPAAKAAAPLPGAGFGGSEAADLTMRDLAEKPSMAQRTSVRPEKPYQPMDISDTGVLKDINAREPSVETPQTASARTAIVTQPIPLSRAMAAVREAAPIAKLKLTAEETQAAMKLVRGGHAPADVMDAITAMRQLKESSSFAKLPTEREMRADLGKQARGGKKSLMGEYGDEPETVGNPFR